MNTQSTYQNDVVIENDIPIPAKRRFSAGEADVIIEDGIPIPPRTRTSYFKKSKYPFAKLTKVGLSFFMRNVDIEKVTSAAWQAKQKLHINLTSRTVIDEGKPIGVRVWRIRAEQRRRSEQSA